MSAVAQPFNAKQGFLSRFIPTERAIARNYVWVTTFLLLCSIIFPLHLQDRLPYNILPSLPASIMVILGGLAIRGTAVLRRTPFDWIMATWVLLVVLSQTTAPLILNRILFERESFGVVLVILNMWMIYRAAFSLTVIDPHAATKGFLFWLVAIILVCTGIGILQSVGPFQQQMVSFAYKVGVGELAIKLGASEVTGVRTTSVFSGPNIFGFVNLLGACIMVGAAMAYRRTLREVHGVIVLLGLGFFAYANLNSQSRMTFVLAALVGIVFLVFLIRAAKWRALLTAGVMFVVFSIATVVLTSQGGYEYMTKIFKTGVTQDESYRVRVQGLENVAAIANDIPILGAGQDQYSLHLYGKGDWYSQANGAGDNGVAMAYLLMGVPGVLHLIALNVVCFLALKRLKTENRVFLAAAKHATWLVFWLYIITIPYCVRYHKIETFSYWLVLFGLVFGLLSVQQHRDRQLARMGMTADEMPDPA